MGNLQASLEFKFLDLKNKEDREYLKKQTEEIIEYFTNKVKERKRDANI